MKHTNALYQTICFTLLFGLSGQSLAQLPSPSSAEFLAQYGLRTINAFPAWSSSTGAGVVVASLDTGANGNHSDLVGQLAAGSSFTDVDSGGGHGSTMAGLIAASFNGSGIIGVAYNARVLALRVADSSRFASASSAASGFNTAAARADVGIISFAAGAVFSEPLNSSILNAMSAGKTVFVRAGNGGQSNPDLPPSLYNGFAGRGLIIGAFDPNKQSTADISNKAGAAANVYLLAPGVLVNGPSNRSNTGQTLWSGSSVATAQVAGAAALILSQNPGMSNADVINIMLSSATDLGAPGVDPINGNGLLNIGAALQAQGDISSSSSGAGGAGVAIAAVVVGGGLAYFWSQNKKAKEKLSKTLVFDGYNRPYIMDLNRSMSVQTSTPTLFNVMNMFDRQTRSVDVDVSDQLSLTMHARTNNPTNYVFLKDSDPFLEVDDQLRNRDLAMKMAGNFNNGLSFDLQHNYSPSSGFDKVGDLSLSENFIWSSSYGSQYMGFGNLSDTLSVGYQASNKLAFRLGANRLDDGLSNGRNSNAVMMQGSYAPTKNTNVSLQVSNLNENGSLLGGASNGVFSVSNASTTAVGVTGKYRIFNKFSLFASFTEGFTNVSEQKSSFLQSFSGLRSQSWGTGLIGSNLFRYNDNAGFAISSPLRISNGNVDLIVPQSLDGSRNIVTSSSRISLAPEGREIDFEAFYRMNLSKRTQLGTSMTYRSTPENTSFIGEGLSVFTTVGLRF